MGTRRPGPRRGLHIVPDLPTPQAAHGPSPIPDVPASRGGRALRALQLVAALWLFIVALSVMKSGAAELAPHLEGSWLTDSLASTLGFGWIFAMLVMSGSPVAAVAITFTGEGVLDVTAGLYMLSGSRLGAATVVLAVAVLYSLRARGDKVDRVASMSIGIFAVFLTAVVYLPSLAIAQPMLETGWLSRVDLAPPSGFTGAIEYIAGPFVDLAREVLSGIWLFVLGLFLLLGSMRMIDHALPAAQSAEEVREHTDWRDNRWLMFGLGSLVALVTMSVSVALTVLVPLVAKRHLHRRHSIPYILGANITTLGDTLLVALMVGEPEGVAVTLAQLAGIVVITGILLLPGIYPRVAELLPRLTDMMLRRRRITMALILLLGVVPVVLLVL